MAQLWVPPSAARDLVEGRKEYEAGVLSFLHLTGGILDDWNLELIKIDPYLRLGQAFEEIPAGYPLIPGYYHLVRLNPTAAPTTTPITGPNDSFMVPTSLMLEKLKASDMQNASAMAARKLAEEKEKREDEKRKQQERDDRRTELFERLDAAREVHISYDTDHRWTQNVNGRRGKHGLRDR